MKNPFQFNNSNSGFIKFQIFCAQAIIFSALGLEKYLAPQPLVQAYLKPFGNIFLFLGILASVSKIILAINALLLKEWARKYLVMLMIPCVIFIFINKFFYDKPYWESREKSVLQEYQQISLQQNIKIQQAKARFEETIKKYPPQEQEYLRQTYDQLNNELPVIMFRAFNLLASTVTLFWHLLIIYFFTLPEVKRLFNPAPEIPPSN